MKRRRFAPSPAAPATTPAAGAHKEKGRARRARRLEEQESSMKKIILSVAVIAAAALAVQQPFARAQNAEEAAVRAAIEHYFRAHATGLGEHHRKVFHPEAKLLFINDGKFTQRTSEEYIAGSPGKPAPDEAQRKRTIEMIDITGDAAVAKLVLDYPNAKLTDYMSLLKIDGEWKIVNKIFSVQRRQKAN